jgi:hypothetical protein
MTQAASSMTQTRTPSAVLAGLARNRPSWPRVLLATVITVFAWTWWSPALRTIFGPTGESGRQVTETFNGGFLVAPDHTTVTGAEPCMDGWCLPPGASGTLVYEVDTSGGVPIVLVWFTLPPNGKNSVSISIDDGTRYQVLSENATYAGRQLDLGIGDRPVQKLLLKFDAFNGSPNQALFIDQLSLDYRAARMPKLPRRHTVLLIVLSFGLAAAVLCRRWPLALSTALILALAASLRFESAVNVFYLPLDPDSVAYTHAAGIMRLFTETGFFSARFGYREPGYVLLLRSYMQVFGTSDFTLRLLTVMLSTLGVWAVLRVARAVWGDVAGQIAGLVMALNVPLVTESARVLRLELEIVLCMAFFYIAFARTWRSGWLLPTLGLSAVGGLLVWTRSTYVPIVLVLGSYAVLRQAGFKAAVGGALITAAVIASCVVPYRYGMFKVYGDPYYDTSLYARWNANAEFVGHPGFPTMSEIQANPFVGPRITYGDYMFGLHTRREIVEGTASGYWKLYRRMEICPWGVTSAAVCQFVNTAFQVIAAAGFVVALWRWRQYLWIPLAFAVFEFPVAFLYDRGLVEPYRHSYTAFPLVLFAAILFVDICTKSFAVRQVTPR